MTPSRGFSRRIDDAHDGCAVVGSVARAKRSSRDVVDVSVGVRGRADERWADAGEHVRARGVGGRVNRRAVRWRENDDVGVGGGVGVVVVRQGVVGAGAGECVR